MEKDILNVDIKSMSKEQRAELLARLQQEEKDDRIARREAYEALRGEFLHEVKAKVEALVDDGASRNTPTSCACSRRPT